MNVSRELLEGRISCKKHVSLQNLLENLLKTDDSAPLSVPKSAGLWWGLGICISHKLPGNVDVGA